MVNKQTYLDNVMRHRDPNYKPKEEKKVKKEKKSFNLQSLNKRLQTFFSKLIIYIKKAWKPVKMILLSPWLVFKMDDMVLEANRKLVQIEKEKIELYNTSVKEILGGTYQLQTYYGNFKFWNGKLGINPGKRVDAYRKNDKFVEVPVTFETSGAVYYWYFYKLEEEK